MSEVKEKVVIGLVGSVLDWGKQESRWSKWRPTVALCRHDDLAIARFELLYQDKFIELAETIRDDILAVSPSIQVNLHQIGLDNPWELEKVYSALYTFARRFPFNPDQEDYLIHITTGTHVTQICMYLLTESHHFPGRLIQTSPPPREQKSLPGEYRVIDLDLSKYDEISARFQEEQDEGVSFLKFGIDTRNAQFNALIEQIEEVAIHSQHPLLIMGPTGAGKSQLAKRIYQLKKVKRQVKGSFVEVNCATLRGDAAMSTLFGHIQGAFTGAIRNRSGLLKAANHGVLFLDEIGELGADEQAMLLRALEEKRFFPMGSDEEIESDFQLIAGTNRDLWNDIEDNRFRDDLFARINIWTFHLPGLKERPEDIEPNLAYELEKFAEITGKSIKFNKEAKERFLRFATSPDATWDANFRDLNAAVIRMATLAKGGRITIPLVDEEIERLKNFWKRPTSSEGMGEHLEKFLDADALQAIDLFDQLQLNSVLDICLKMSSLAEAGRHLFPVSRLEQKRLNDSDRLRKYLKRFNIEWADIQSLKS